MKDAAHHLKHVQRKIIQAARKEDRMNQGSSGSGIEPFESHKTVIDQKASNNNNKHNNRLPGYRDMH